MKRTVTLLLALLLTFSLAACGEKTPTWQEQYDLGQKYLTEGNYEEAILAFTAAIEIDPKRPEAYLSLADAYEAFGDPDAARKTLEDGLAATNDPEIQARLEALSPSSEIPSGVTPIGDPEYTSTYDAQGNLLHYYRMEQGVGYEVHRRYDAQGNLTDELRLTYDEDLGGYEMDCETGEMLRYFYDDNGPLRNPRGEPVPCTRYYDRAGQEVYYYAPLLNWDADTYEVLSADFYYPDGTLDYRVENDEDNWWNETYYDASGYVRVGSYCDAAGNLVGYVSYNADGSVSRYVILG